MPQTTKNKTEKNFIRPNQFTEIEGFGSRTNLGTYV